MILGQVNARREPIISVTVYGYANKPVTVEAVVDTGFDDYLTLPLEIIATLALVAREIMPVMLSDGTIVQAMHFEAEADWHGKRIPIIVQAAQGTPLVGMTLMEGNRLTIEAEPGGLVTIQKRRNRKT